MKTFGFKFTDGTIGHCEGETAFDAVRIAEFLTEKTVDLAPEHKYKPQESPNVWALPYPTARMIWQFEHPMHGKTPAFCSGGVECRNRGSCPKSYACTE
jgi:hypothetical protein